MSQTEDRFTTHQRKAAKAGGQSRSAAKIAAARANLAKARAKRHDRSPGPGPLPSVPAIDDLPPASQPELEALDR